MSRVTINEENQSSLATFAVTDNVVLVPLCLKSGSGLTAEAKEYSDADDFTTDFQDDVATYASSSDSLADKTYYMIIQLLNLGLKVVVKPILYAGTKSGDSDYASETAIITAVNTAIGTNKLYEEFKSRNIYNIKFVTSGAYPNAVFLDTTLVLDTNSCYDTLSTIAKDRGDALALIELSNNVDTDNVVTKLNSLSVSQKTYATCIYPGGEYTVGSQTLKMPGAYGYLTAYATSVQSNPNWLAAAGISRGKVSGLIKPDYYVTEALANVLNGIDKPSGTTIMSYYANPITKIGSYGYRVFGNRTMSVNSSATKANYTDFLNVRVMLCDIKKQIYDAATRLTFEPNDNITYINFKTLVNVLLDKMKSGRGLEYYTWQAVESKQRATIEATLTIKPIEAVEQFVVNIVLTDSDATTTEDEE